MPSLCSATRASLLARCLLALLVSLVVGGGAVAAQEGTPGPGPATPPAAPFVDAPPPVLPATVTDVEGNQVEVTDVGRIVPLNGDVAEIVWALGLGDGIVGVDVSATYPPAVMEPLPKIGYQRQLSAEGVLSLRPSVVIGTPAAGPLEVLAQVREAGVPVVIVAAEETTIEAAAAKIRAVAAALGVAERGEELAARTQAEIVSATARVAAVGDRPSVLFLYVRGGGTQLIAGAETAADAMITAAGGVNAGAEAGLVGFQPLTAESLAAAQPEVLLLLSAGLESIGGVEGLLQLPGVAQTPAGEEGRVLAYDDLYLLGLGPRTGQALAELAAGLHPDLPAATPAAARSERA